MLRTNPSFSPQLYFTHALRPGDWYEDFYQATPSSTFIRIARKRLPLSWSLQLEGVWTHVSPPNLPLPRQGWKLHISAQPKDVSEILEKCIHICAHHEVAFKFLLDPSIFQWVNSKGSGREGGGKFITIYPMDIQHFEAIADELHEALAVFEGPHILSDKPYKDSQVVYYRYGAFTGYPNLSIFGTVQLQLRAPNGDLVSDGRSSFFNPPAWVSDPFSSEETQIHEADTSPETTIYLKDGRYRIEEAMQFSLTGGVYKATDMDSGKTVVIKEARPHINIEAEHQDAITRLAKEHRLLTKLSETGITPEPIDLFYDWKHLFLVEEFLEGDTLSSALLSGDFDEQDRESFAEEIHAIGSRLAYAVKVAHDHDIIINDFASENAIFSTTDGTLRLIDLEAAWEENVDVPVETLRTMGFQPKEGIKNKSDDMHGLASVIFSRIYSITPILELEPEAKTVFLDAAAADGFISHDLKELLAECIDTNEKTRPTAAEFLDRFENAPVAPTPVAPEENYGIHDPLLSETLDKILDSIKSNTTFDRKDRLFPSDPNLFLTNPLSVAHGAAGVAHALASIEDKVPEGVISWMLTQEISKERYTPGLYLGLSGIAWVFWELGLNGLALKLMRMASEHPLLWELPDVYYGAAGFGMACLYFHKETGDPHWLEQAARIGDKLIEIKTESDKGFYWSDMVGNVWTGYARGATGISLFLLYLYLASGDSRFKATGRAALDYDLGSLTEIRGKLGVPRATADSIPSIHKNVHTHYWSEGSAGICTTLLRYISAFGENSDNDMLAFLTSDTRRNYMAFPTLFTGLAGLGEVQLDAFNFIKDPKFLSSAFYVASGIRRFQIEKPDGIAFPGEQLLRLSNDFGSGSAGIALFLHRLLNREKSLPNSNFLLDDLLCKKN